MTRTLVALVVSLCSFHAFADEVTPIPEPVMQPQVQACVEPLTKPKAGAKPRADRRRLQISATFEADTRQAFDVYEQEIEAQDERKISALRYELADIQNKNPQGFNTFVKNESRGMGWLVRSMLALGQEEKVKWLVGELLVETRHLYRELQAQGEVKEEAIQAYFAADLKHSQGLGQLIQKITANRVELKRQLAEKFWLYSGVTSALLEEAGLQKRSGLLPEGIERALQENLTKAFVRSAAVASEVQEESMMAGSKAPAAQDRAEAAKLTALRVLQSLRMLESDGKTEIAPKISDFESLFASSAIIRAKKLESEIKFERSEQKTQNLLRLFSDQYVGSLAITALNAASFGKFKDNLNEVRADLEKNAARAISRGRILEFVDLANRLSDDVNGNLQLVNALQVLLGSNPALLKQMAITVECIDPLRRVKGTDFAKTTIWSEKGTKLAEYIEELEAKRGQNLTSVSTVVGNRTHVLTPVVSLLVTYAATMYGSTITHAGMQSFETLKTLLMGLIGH